MASVWVLYRGAAPRQWVAFVRNYRVTGALFYVPDNLGSELHLSNVDCSTATTK